MPDQEQGPAAEMDTVDTHPDSQRATEPDEEQVLAGLYGPPDADGFYRGEAL